MHQGTQCYSRIDFAITVAREHFAPLIVCGDANEGRDVRAFCERARCAGVATVCQAVWTGGASNTYRDLEMAVRMLVNDPEFGGTEAFRLVTDPWHMPRAEAMAQRLIREVCAEANRPAFFLRTSEVSPYWNPPAWRILNERQGLDDFLAGRYDPSRRLDPLGKPAHAVEELKI